MRNASQSQASSFRFSIRSLIVAITVFAVLIASCLAINRSLNRQFGYGPFASYDDWPRALKSLVDPDEKSKNDVAPFGLSDFMDHCSIWQINAESDLRTKLVESHELISTTMNHPKADLLISSIPPSWKKPDAKKCKWFATPGYGTKHIEGLDLFLIMDDPDSGNSIVLHEWLF